MKRVEEYQVTCDASNNLPSLQDDILRIRLRVRTGAEIIEIDLPVPTQRMIAGRLKTVWVEYR